MTDEAGIGAGEASFERTDVNEASGTTDLTIPTHGDELLTGSESRTSTAPDGAWDSAGMGEGDAEQHQADD